MSRDLPPRANLEHLKKQAKSLLEQLEQSNPRATLAEAQHALAKEYGFANWAKLKQHVESLYADADPTAALARAILDDKVAEVKTLLAKHPRLKETLNAPIPSGDFGEKPLNVASRHKNRAMVDLLLANGANINDKSDWWAGGFSLLESCDPGFASFLIERGARLSAHSAARLDRLDALRRIVTENPGAVHERGGDGQFPLHFAATPEIAEFLLDRGAEIDAIDVDHESTAAQWALEDRRAVTRFLVDRGARCDILMGATLGDVNRVRAILDADPKAIETAVSPQFFPMRDPRAGGHIYTWTVGGGLTAFHIAFHSGNQELLSLLMSRARDEQRLAIACESGDEKTIESLLSQRPNLVDSLSPAERRRITAAAEHNNVAAVRRMLRIGWPSVPDANGEATPLHWAAWLGNAEMVRDLLASGAPTEVRESKFGGTPLGWALHGLRNSRRRDRSDYVSVVRSLLAAGAIAPDLSAEDMAALPAALREVIANQEDG